MIKTMFTFYPYEVGRLEQFIVEARAAAKLEGERFGGLSFDVDDDGFVTIHAAGIDSIKL